VFGFGNEDTYETLTNKHKKDKMVTEKMKKVDRAAFADNDFNKDMFFENTFSHQQFERRSDP